MAKRDINEESFIVKGFSLGKHMFDSISEHDEQTYWKDFVDTFSEKSFNGPHGNVKISADWHSIVNKFIHKTVENDGKIIVTVSSDSKSFKNEFFKRNLFRNYVELYLNHIFLVVNISAPSTFDLYGVIIGEGSSSINLKLKMSSEVYGFACRNRFMEDSAWPKLCLLPLPTVNTWLESVNFGLRQLSSNRIEKTLFSFLHLANVSDYLYDSIIWLCYALEGLYDTPFTSVKKMLSDRICIVLGQPTRAIKKKISEFYDIRSDFVHGRR